MTGDSGATVRMRSENRRIKCDSARCVESLNYKSVVYSIGQAESIVVGSWYNSVPIEVIIN